MLSGLGRGGIEVRRNGDLVQKNMSSVSEYELRTSTYKPVDEGIFYLHNPLPPSNKNFEFPFHLHFNNVKSERCVWRDRPWRSRDYGINQIRTCSDSLGGEITEEGGKKGRQQERREWQGLGFRTVSFAILSEWGRDRHFCRAYVSQVNNTESGSNSKRRILRHLEECRNVFSVHQ